MHIFNKKGLTYVIIFTHSNVLCYLERCFSPVEVIISIEATAIGDAWRCLYAQPRCPASFYWEMAICYLATNKCMQTPDINLVKSTFISVV